MLKLQDAGQLCAFKTAAGFSPRADLHLSGSEINAGPPAASARPSVRARARAQWACALSLEC